MTSDTLFGGVGGIETVFARRVERLRVDEHGLADFEVQIGSMDYGFEINGILGMDFLTQAGAVIDLFAMRVEFSSGEHRT